MKRLLLYIAVLAALLLLPANGTDIGKLLPVELVLIDVDADWVVLQTDTQDSGRGKTVEEAVQNLKDTTAGIVFLDTADYLLITPEASDKAGALTAYLKGSVRICMAEGEPDLERAADYLAVHPPKATLKAYRETADAQFLRNENGRLILR